MSPSSFTFKLTVPKDPDGVTVVAAMAAHAVDYATLDAAAGAEFVDRVRAMVAEAQAGSTGAACLVVFAAADGRLTVTIGSQSVSQPLPA
jgi:hypothetical protein